jgi:hypothetical protein
VDPLIDTVKLHRDGVNAWKQAAWLVLAAAFWSLLPLLTARGGADAPGEYQVKAVFVFNFSQFVEWPHEAFASDEQSFVIGVLGSDPFGERLDEAIKGEVVNDHPLVIRRFSHIEDVQACQILFIDRSQSAQLPRILSALDHRSILTVSDVDKASERGVMIQFATQDNRIRLRINVDSARAAGLTISSKLLRPAEIVTTRGGE